MGYATIFAVNNDAVLDRSVEPADLGRAVQTVLRDALHSPCGQGGPPQDAGAHRNAVSYIDMRHADDCVLVVVDPHGVAAGHLWDTRDGAGRALKARADAAVRGSGGWHPDRGSTPPVPPAPGGVSIMWSYNDDVHEVLTAGPADLGKRFVDQFGTIGAWGVPSIKRAGWVGAGGSAVLAWSGNRLCPIDDLAPDERAAALDAPDDRTWARLTAEPRRS